MSGKNLYVIGQHCRQLPSRGVLGAHEVVCVLGPKQVWPAARSVEQRAAGEHGYWPGDADVGKHVGQVRERMAWRSNSSYEHPRADWENVAVVHRGPGKRHLVLGVDQIRRACVLSQRQPACDVVVMDVRLEDVGESDALIAEHCQDAVDVPLRIDYEGDLAVVDEVAPIPETRRLERDDCDGVDFRHLRVSRTVSSRCTLWREKRSRSRIPMGVYVIVQQENPWGYSTSIARAGLLVHFRCPRSPSDERSPARDALLPALTRRGESARIFGNRYPCGYV